MAIGCEDSPTYDNNGDVNVSPATPANALPTTLTKHNYSASEIIDYTNKLRNMAPDERYSSLVTTLFREPHLAAAAVVLR